MVSLAMPHISGRLLRKFSYANILMSFVMLLSVSSIGSLFHGRLVGAQSPECVFDKPLYFSAKSDVKDNYVAWARVRSPEPHRLLLGAGEQCAQVELGATKDWSWVKFKEPLQLAMGEQKLALSSDGTEIQLDKLLLMLDGSCTPEGKNGDNCALENIDITISGVEERIIAGSDMRVFAEVHGAANPEVAFFLDGKRLDNSAALKENELFCAVGVDGELCDILPATVLGVGGHTMSVTVSDEGRTVTSTSEITVVLAQDGDSDQADRVSQQEPVPVRRSVDEQPQVVQSKSEPIDQIAAPNKELTAEGEVSEVPLFVLGQGSVLAETVSGKIGLSVPIAMMPKDGKRLEFYVDEQLAGGMYADELPFIVDTSQLVNRGHQIKAIIESDDGQREIIEVEMVVNNSSLTVVKNWLSKSEVRTATVIVLGAAALGVSLMVARSHIRSLRLKQVTGVNTQRIEFISPSRMGLKSYGVLCASLLMTLGLALVMAPATPAYSGNASMLVELEDTRLNYEHPTGVDEVDQATYIILR